MLLIGAESCPVIRCDECDELIESDSDGVYVWDGTLTKDGTPPIFLHHNSSAAGFRCHERFEQRHPDFRWSWGHLREWFRFLDVNVKATDRQGHRLMAADSGLTQDN